MGGCRGRTARRKECGQTDQGTATEWHGQPSRAVHRQMQRTILGSLTT